MPARPTTPSRGPTDRIEQRAAVTADGGAAAIHALLALECAYPRLWRMLEQEIAGDRNPLSRSEMRILQAVSFPDRAVAGALARELDIDAGQLSRMLDRLARRRLVVRLRAEPDGRKKRIVLTDRGRLALAELDRAALRLAVRVLGPLSSSDRQRLIDAAQTIGHALGGQPAQSAGAARRLARPAPRP